MIEHAARDHAQWSASATERNWNCPGALALTDQLPDKTSSAADWGTCAHEIAELCLLNRNKTTADEFIGSMRRGKEHEFEVDEEMAETAQVYVDYVLKRIHDYRKETGDEARLWIEQKFSLIDLKPPFDAGGTADAVIYFPKWKLLEVVDLKSGRGHVVEVTGNPQLRTYGLGAMLANKGLMVNQITVTIVQPRAPHKSGRTRSETFHVMDLVEWTVELVAAMKRSAQAMEARENIGRPDGPASEAAWGSEHLNAGDHCKFCKAAGFCPALQQKALDAAGIWFDDLDQPRISNAPSTLSPEALGQALDAADMIGDWVNAVRAFAHGQAEAGVEIPHYVLVPKEGREKWNDDAAASKAVSAALAAGLSNDKVLNAPKAKTPKQIRTALTKAKKSDVAAALQELSNAEVKGTNLVRATKTTRAAVQPAVHKHFDVLD